MNNTIDNATRWQQIARGAALPLTVLVMWHVWAQSHPAGSPAPAPLRVVKAAVELIATGGLLEALVQSLGRVLLGFTGALVLGVILGVLMGSDRKSVV